MGADEGAFDALVPEGGAARPSFPHLDTTCLGMFNSQQPPSEEMVILGRLRVAVVQPDGPVRRGVTALLSDTEDVTVVAQCGDAAAAVDALARVGPDVALLDMSLATPEVAEAISGREGQPAPIVIAISNRESDAVRAFEVQAADFLLTPVGRGNLDSALERARVRQAAWRNPAAAPQDSTIVVDPLDLPSRFAVRIGTRVLLIEVADIQWIEAAGNNVRLHTSDGVHVMRTTMHQLERMLDPHSFVRIHRSAIVNLARVVEMQSWFNGEYLVVTTSGSKLHTSRTYRHRLKSALVLG